MIIYNYKYESWQPSNKKSIGLHTLVLNTFINNIISSFVKLFSLNKETWYDFF